MLRENLELIESLKVKIAGFEEENEKIAEENEDFRQFSLDGYEIAKNVQALSAEREKLSVDLADKAQVIRKLLDENEKLNSKLKVAQKEASNLIQSTMGSQGFRTTAKTQSSPLRRSALYY
jgi:predicted RNase H-like nuclease (RuvC/YqgF family)